MNVCRKRESEWTCEERAYFADLYQVFGNDRVQALGHGMSQLDHAGHQLCLCSRSFEEEKRVDSIGVLVKVGGEDVWL